MQLPLMQLVLGGAHEELKERNQAPSVLGEQLVPEALFDFLDIFDKPNQLTIVVQQLVTSSIQLSHHLCHFAVLSRSAMGISQLIIGAPTRNTRAGRAQTVDSHLSTIHAEGIQISTAPAHLQTIWFRI
jgi:hypothetical protein